MQAHNIKDVNHCVERRMRRLLTMSRMKSMFIARKMGMGEGGSPHCRVQTLPANTPSRNDIDREEKGLSDQSNINRSYFLRMQK